MDYERKYKEALERAKAMIKVAANQDEAIGFANTIFPELAESEGERIRKEIIDFIYDETSTYEYALKEKANSWLAWLEKQNSNIDNANKEYWRGYREGKQEILDKYANLEKQGEQKSVVIIPKFRIGDNIKTTNEELLTITKIDGKGYWSEDLFICSFDDSAKWELVEQKPTDKVEPKFKVGDLVKYTNYYKQPIYKVNYIDKECYICTSDNTTLGDKAVMHFAFDNPYLRLVEQKPQHMISAEAKEAMYDKSAWSEEDELYMNECINAIATKDGWTFEEKRKTKHWLKSLKQRIGG